MINNSNTQKKSQINSSGAVYKKLLKSVKPYWLAFTLGIVGNLLYGIVDAGFIKLLEPLLNEGFVAHNQSFIIWIPFVVIGIFLIRGMATFMSTFFMGWVGRNVVMNFRQKMFEHLLKLPSSYYDKTTSGELLSKITYNVEQVADASTDALTVLVRESCTAISLLVVMLSVSWQLTLLFLVTVPLMAYIMSFVSKRMRKVSSAIQDSIGKVTHVAEEAIEGQKVIKAFGGQAYEIAQFAKVTQNNRRQEMKLIATSAISVPIIQCIGSIALAATIYLATNGTGGGVNTPITPGAFAAFVAAMIALLKPIKQLTKVNSNIQKGIAGAASIFAFLDEKPEIDNGKIDINKLTGNIIFKNVNFSYHLAQNINTSLDYNTAQDYKILNKKSSSTLSNINFTVKPGEIIAIVGRSGSGKSTLVNLLPRFYDNDGEIYFDNINIYDIPLEQLRSQFAIVTQNVVLFNDTIAKNIAYGSACATQADIIEAATSAYCVDFIENLPQGFDTVIGENGIRLSGGQRQRIAIARAIMKKAPILILDEATSALDTESERKIQSALEQLMSKCTTLVIAHRLSTVENADRIMVVDNGSIVEMGTHKELMESKGIYSSLRLMQYQDSNINTGT